MKEAKEVFAIESKELERRFDEQKSEEKQTDGSMLTWGSRYKPK